jgi:CelD/BcsL family acetyltransferase involved in cellulose biosynthesis
VLLHQALSAESVPLADVDGDLLRAWRELAAEAVEPNPFFGPEVLLPAARRLPGGDRVRLMVVRQGARLVLAMPVTSARYRRIPLRTLSTWRHSYRYVGTPLLVPDTLGMAPAVALEALARTRRPGWLVLEQLYLDGPVASAFRNAAVGRSAGWVEHDVWQRPAVEAREEETYLRGTLAPRSAKALRRQRRNLERDLGPVLVRDVALVGEPEAVEAEIDAFLAMESAGWKGRAGTAMASDPAHASFWREACRALANAGRLELWQLVAGDVVVARQVHVRAGDTVFHLKTTYDEGLAQRSPGVQLELEVLHAFHVDATLRCIDPCTDPGRSTSDRLYPDSRRFGDALVGLTPTGRRAAQLMPTATAAWRKLRRGPMTDVAGSLAFRGLRRQDRPTNRRHALWGSSGNDGKDGGG